MSADIFKSYLRNPICNHPGILNLKFLDGCRWGFIYIIAFFILFSVVNIDLVTLSPF